MKFKIVLHYKCVLPGFINIETFYLLTDPPKAFVGPGKWKNVAPDNLIINLWSEEPENWGPWTRAFFILSMFE